MKGGSKKKPDNIKFPGYGKKPPTQEKEAGKKEECEESTDEQVGEEGDDSNTTTTKSPDNGNDSVSVSSPDDDAAIAEAKPVGLGEFFILNQLFFTIKRIFSNCWCWRSCEFKTSEFKNKY